MKLVLQQQQFFTTQTVTVFLIYLLMLSYFTVSRKLCIQEFAKMDVWDLNMLDNVIDNLMFTLN